MIRNKIFVFFLAMFWTTLVVAQPPKRRAEAAARATATQNAPLGTSYRMFPTASSMPENVVWKRDVYRKLDLSNEHNATLGYPNLPQNGQCNLFTYLMKTILRKQIHAYRYNINTGTESFDPKEEISAKQIMDDKGIYYQLENGRLRVEDADLSVDDVKKYYIKESIFYNQQTATFHTQVTALCPVIVRGDAEFGGADMEYPVFWVNYEEAEPYLHKLMVMGSSLNNASMISAADYFTMHYYRGDIYKVVNLQEKMLVPKSSNDTAVVKARELIETELKDFKHQMWTGMTSADSLARAKADSIQQHQTANANEEGSKTVRRRSVTSRRRSSLPKSSTPAAPKQKKVKPERAKSSGSGRSGGLSVRRQRH